MKLRLVAFIVSAAMLTACTNMASPHDNPTSEITEKVRAIGLHGQGRLMVQSVMEHEAVPLGVPSCQGLETDLKWTGDFEVVWDVLDTENSTVVMSLPKGTELIQQQEAPVQMQKLTMGDTSVFVYSPEYRGCHGVETYMFGVKDSEAFPVTFDMGDDQIKPLIIQSSPCLPRLINEQLIITGAYGAGQDTIDVYHFSYDSDDYRMLLQFTEQIEPNSLPCFFADE